MTKLDANTLFKTIQGHMTAGQQLTISVMNDWWQIEKWDKDGQEAVTIDSDEESDFAKALVQAATT